MSTQNSELQDGSSKTMLDLDKLIQSYLIWLKYFYILPF